MINPKPKRSKGKHRFKSVEAMVKALSSKKFYESWKAQKPKPTMQKDGERVVVRWDAEKFYNLMQNYRHMPIHKQKEVIDAFEAVEDFMRRAILTAIRRRTP